MSIERDGYHKELREFNDRDRRAKVRPSVMQGRRVEGALDMNQLPIKQALQGRAPTGEMYFVLGYSSLDGPDIVRP